MIDKTERMEEVLALVRAKAPAEQRARSHNSSTRITNKSRPTTEVKLGSLRV